MSKHSFELKKKVVLEYSDSKGGVKYLSTKSDTKELYQIRKIMRNIYERRLRGSWI